MALAAGTKIDTRKVRYAVVRSALERLKLTQCDDDPSALIVWWDGLMQMSDFSLLYPHQRVNKIPGMDVLCYKNTFFQALSRMHHHFPSLYHFFPTTFQLPFQFGDFQREHLRLCAELSQRPPSSSSHRGGVTWIVKPQIGCCGNGIRLIQNCSDVATHTDLAIVQRYVAPYLIDGYKFDFRFYVLIATLDPLTIYLYNEGLARFCTHLYAPPTRDTLGDRFSHLTNTAVNVGNAHHSRPILEYATSVLARIARVDGRGCHLWRRIRHAALLSVVAQYQSMLQNTGLVSADGRRESQPPRDWKPPQRAIDDRRRYFHILGIDVMVNDRCDPIVLEINDRPSLCVTYELEQPLKVRMLADALSAITVDGSERTEGAIVGGWERLLPCDPDGPLGRAVAQIQQMANLGQQSTAKRLIARRLGYVPAETGGQQQQPRGSPCVLPPLHQ
jgi:hypothetical protein